MNKELVSLIIPCYNEEQVLPILNSCLQVELLFPQPSGLRSEIHFY